MKFSESAIRERLKARYVLRQRNNGRARPDLDAAIRDVQACLREIQELRSHIAGFYPRHMVWDEPVARGVKEGVI